MSDSAEIGLQLSGIARPIRLIDCAELAPVLREVLRGWEVRESPDTPSDPADITIRRVADGYRRDSRWLDKPKTYPDPVNAVCDLLVDVIKAYIADRPSLLCLHCAAVAFGDGLVIFPSVYEAGKSVLSVICAAQGLRVFADDVLPLDGASSHGIAPGILPRLRLPLPADSALENFVADRPGPESARFRYVGLASHELAPLGETAPVRGVVLLRRDDVDAPVLEAISGSEILKRAILQNFSQGISALDMLDQLHAMVMNARCYEMRYQSGQDAVALLRRNFETGRVE